MSDKEERQFQNGFERYEDSLAAISTFKGVVNTDDRRQVPHDYHDLGELAEERGIDTADHPHDREIQCGIVDPEAPVKFLRVFDRLSGEEMAFIPWEEAEEIYYAVMQEKAGSRAAHNHEEDYYDNERDPEDRPDYYKNERDPEDRAGSE